MLYNRKHYTINKGMVLFMHISVLTLLCYPLVFLIIESGPRNRKEKKKSILVSQDIEDQLISIT